MPDEEQLLRDAYGYFANWDNDKDKFAALLADDVQWSEKDSGLGHGEFKGKAAVMAHLQTIKDALAGVQFVSVERQGSFWRTTDEMRLQGHEHHHDCDTDVVFDGGLITKVRHCLGGGGSD